MAKETVGYVYLRWTCPNCGTKNKGTDRFCSSCGSPQPDNVQFEQPSQEELIKDQAELEKAKLGPDVHCAYCGSRNQANASHCTQCGADLTQATKRETGKVLGAHRDKPAEKVICPACGTPNEPDAAKCVQCGASLTTPKPEAKPQAEPAKAKGGMLLPGIVVAVILVLCIGGICAFIFFSQQTETVGGQVVDVQWVRTVPIMGLVPVDREDWRDEIPAEAELGACRQELHHTEEEPVSNAEKVCGTPYTVDQGSGFGEVVQDCVYNVYQDFCEYTVEEWQQVDELSVNGTDLNPYWPQATPGVDQRLGTASEEYQVTFRTEEGEYTYTADLDEFNQFQPGTRWKLNVNSFNAVVSVEPE
jgi:hypothetical protein